MFSSLGRIDIFTAGDDHILFPIDHVDIPLFIDLTDVFRVEPALFEGLLRLLLFVPVSPGKAEPARAHLSDALGNDVVIVVDDLRLHIDRRSAAGGEDALVACRQFPATSSLEMKVVHPVVSVVPMCWPRMEP